VFTLKQLHVFISLAHKQKVVDVAREFNITQAAVSMSIKELETILSERLFERVGKRLTLNERGALFLEQVSSHVEALQKAYVNFTSQRLEGHLRICASATISDYVLPSLIDEYIKKKTNIKFLLKTANTKEVVERVKSGDFDLGFVEGEYDDETIVAKKLMVDELVIVTADASLSKKKQFIDALAQKEWVLREAGSGTRSVFLDTISPIKINIYMEFDQTQTIKRFLKLNPSYISCLPKRSVQQELDAGVLFAVSIQGHTFKRDFKLIMRQEKQASALVHDFTSFVIKAKEE
jgi:DNA-binding transcriptional LysR family regulator